MSLAGFGLSLCALFEWTFARGAVDEESGNVVDGVLVDERLHEVRAGGEEGKEDDEEELQAAFGG